VIVADTGAIVALVDASDRYHAPIRALFEENPGAWVLPWAILPEVDYLLGTHVGRKAQDVIAVAERVRAKAIAPPSTYGISAPLPFEVGPSSCHATRSCLGLAHEPSGSLRQGCARRGAKLGRS
jgi:hypothetical protein